MRKEGLCHQVFQNADWAKLLSLSLAVLVAPGLLVAVVGLLVVALARLDATADLLPVVAVIAVRVHAIAVHRQLQEAHSRGIE